MIHYPEIIDAIRALEQGQQRNHITHIVLLPNDTYQATGFATHRATTFERVWIYDPETMKAIEL